MNSTMVNKHFCHKLSTHICVILDISTSMQDRFSEVIDALNQFIRIQQSEQANNFVTLSLMIFGKNQRYHIKDVNLQAVKQLSALDFILENATSLYDAIGICVEDCSNRKNVTMCIITDGQDNYSKKYTNQSIRKMLDTKQKYVGWEIIYLSSSIETFNTGIQLNVNTNIRSSNNKMAYDIVNNMNRACTQSQERQRNRI